MLILGAELARKWLPVAGVDHVAAALFGAGFAAKVELALIRHVHLASALGDRKRLGAAWFAIDAQRERTVVG